MVSSISGSSGYASILSEMGSLGKKKKKGAGALADEMMSALDTDGDGSLGASELTSGLSGSDGTSASDLLSALDTDGDGQVSTQELTDGLKALHEKFKAQLDNTAMATMLSADAGRMADGLLAQADTDGNGTLDKSELSRVLKGSATAAATSDGTAAASSDDTAGVDDLFSSLDTDGDGQVSQQELAAGLKAQQDKLKAQADDAAATAGTPAPPPPAGHAGGRMADEMMSGLDTDGDGALSQSELAAGMAGSASTASTGTAAAGSSTTASGSSAGASTLFSALDTNHDGTVSAEELAADLSSLFSQAGGQSGASSSASFAATRQYQTVDSFWANGTLGTTGKSGASGLSVNA